MEHRIKFQSLEKKIRVRGEGPKDQPIKNQELPDFKTWVIQAVEENVALREIEMIQ